MRSFLRARRPLAAPTHGPAARVVGVALAVLALTVLLLRSGPADEIPLADDTVPPPVVRAEGVALARADFRGCVDCHDDVDRGLVTDGVLSFRHEEHFLTGVTACISCHPAVSHEPEVADRPAGSTPELIARPTMDRCVTCHGLTEIAVAPGECATCHVTEVDPEPPSHLVVAWQGRGHADAALDDAYSCQMCHEPPTCEACHGLPMPHPEAFDERPHAEETYALDLTTCAGCHERAPELPGRDSCGSCHHPDGELDVPWRAAHPAVVREDGGTPCFACHVPATCADCHLTGEEDYGRDRARFLAPPADVAPLRSEDELGPPPSG